MTKATTTRKTFNRETFVNIDIQADPKTIWSLLTNAENYPKWNSTVLSIEGKIALGGKIKLKSYLDPKRVFKLSIKEFEPNKRLVWGDAMGKRVYNLTTNSSGQTNFSMTEKIGGPLFPLFAKMIPPFDELLRNFYDSSMTGNFGHLLEVYNHIEDNDPSQAASVNSTINPDNSMEWNEVMVNEIYLATWAVGVFEFDANQYDILYNIAIQNPLTGGLAVYSARVMLDLEVDDNETESGRFANPNSSGNETTETFIVTTSSNVLHYSESLASFGTFYIHDVLGQLVFSQQLTDRETDIELNLNRFLPGTYIYSVISKNGTRKNGKVIIIK